MKRRKFLTGAATAGVAVAAASSFPKPSIAQDVKELNFTGAFPKGLPGIGTGQVRIQERINTMSGGSLKANFFAGGELNPPTEILQTVQSGAADIGLDPAYWHVNLTNDLGFFTAVPFGLTISEQNAWIQFGGGQAFYDEVYADFDQKPFLAGNTGNQTFGWFPKPLTQLSDLQGLKMRIPGFGGQVMAKLGVIPQFLATSDIAPALEAGTIDAAEFVGPAIDEILGFQKVVKFMHWPGFQEPGPALTLAVNLSTWGGLSDEHKTIIETAALAENSAMPAEINAGSVAALTRMIQNDGVQSVRVPEEILVALGNASGELVEEIIDTGTERTKRLAAHWLSFRDKAIPWAAASDQGFWNMRALDYSYPTGS